MLNYFAPLSFATLSCHCLNKSVKTWHISNDAATAATKLLQKAKQLSKTQTIKRPWWWSRARARPPCRARDHCHQMLGASVHGVFARMRHFYIIM